MSYYNVCDEKIQLIAVIQFTTSKNFPISYNLARTRNFVKCYKPK